MDILKMFKHLSMKSAKLHHFVKTAMVCLFTDESLYGSSLVITQVVEWDLGSSMEKQAHQAIVILSRCFIEAELNWTLTEKKAFLL